MRRVLRAVIWAVAGYVIGALLGAFLIAAYSTNTFDRDMEIGMTAIFAAGPFGAVVAFIAGLVWPSPASRKMP